jgi:hypothetical protein
VLAALYLLPRFILGGSASQELCGRFVACAAAQRLVSWLHSQTARTYIHPVPLSGVNIFLAAGSVLAKDLTFGENQIVYNILRGEECVTRLGFQILPRLTLNTDICLASPCVSIDAIISSE